ncbi:MAG: transcriptional regulator [Firmicutes bacterium]|nr:transcriptional regulator [Bacillota bacterium]
MDITEELAERIISLRIATRLPCMCEESGKALLTLKSKALFLLSKHEKLAPQEIMSKLRILKPNMAALAKELEAEGLIEKAKNIFDRRNIVYSITDAGRNYVSRRLEHIARGAAGIFDNQADYDTMIAKIDDVIGFLAFMTVV